MAGIIPLDEIRRLQKRINRLMEDLGLSDLEAKYVDEMNRISQRMGNVMEEYDTSNLGPNTLMPMADVRETDDSLIVAMDLPGINKEDVDISVTESDLRVVAERKSEKEIDEKDYHKRERTFTRFERMVKLPVAVRGDEARARLNNGVLEITLPKEVVTTKKRISIE